MTAEDRALIKFRKSRQEATGYMWLARIVRDTGKDDTKMKEAALRALRRISDDDDLMDALSDVADAHES